MRRVVAAFIICTACARHVPPHLLVNEPTPEELIARSVTDLPSTIELLANRDPLVRAPPLPERDGLDDFESGKPVLAYLDLISLLESGEGAPARELQELEETYPESLAVPLSRGYRLRMIENRLAQWTEPDESVEAEIARLLFPLPATARADGLPRSPLEWVLEGDHEVDRLRAMSDQWALRSWFCSPHLPLTVVGNSLRQARYAGLAETDLGRLLIARAEATSADDSSAWSNLEEATWLALNHAAADRDHEQAAWAALRKEAIDRTGASRPIAAELRQAIDGLSNNASNDRAAGGALTALAALDWHLGCQPRCSRLDRVRALDEASRWGPEVAAIARTWQVIALKEAIDTLDVGHDTVLYPRAMVGLLDALIGTGAGSVDQALLRQQNPDATTWLAIGRSVGTDGLTDWDGASVALGQHLSSMADRAIQADPPGRYLPLLQRIRHRAVP